MRSLYRRSNPSPLVEFLSPNLAVKVRTQVEFLQVGKRKKWGVHGWDERESFKNILNKSKNRGGNCDQESLRRTREQDRSEPVTEEVQRSMIWEEMTVDKKKSAPHLGNNCRFFVFLFFLSDLVNYLSMYPM